MDQFYAQLDALYLEGDNRKTEQFLLNTLQRVRAGGEARSAEAAGIMNEISGFYRGVSRYSESLHYGAEAMKLLELHGMKDTPQFATMMVNYAGALRLSGQLDASRERFLAAKDLLERLNAENTYQYVSLLNNLALTDQDLGQFDEAVRLTEQAVELMRQRSDREDEVPTGLTNLATLYLRQGKTEQAEATVLEALTEFRKLSDRSAHEAAALSVLGTLQFGRREYENAAESFRESVRQTEAVFGKNVDYASALRSLALTERALGNHSETVRCMEEACGVLKKLLGSQHPRFLQMEEELKKVIGEAEA